MPVWRAQLGCCLRVGQPDLPSNSIKTEHVRFNLSPEAADERIVAAPTPCQATPARPGVHGAEREQLVRYEALFKLLDDIRSLDDGQAVADAVATQWKYSAQVGPWRLVLAAQTGYLLVEAHRGRATVTQQASLSAWDAHHWHQQRPCSVLDFQAPGQPAPPPALVGPATREILVIPFQRGGQCAGVLSMADKGQGFSTLDHKFIRLAGSHVTDHLANLLARQQVLDALRQRALHDGLTGALNRIAIVDLLHGQLKHARRTAQPLSILMADIDFFKSVNDTHGHLAGDEVLRETVQRFTALSRESDRFGRYGGEEFLFVLYPCSIQDAVQVAERYRAGVAASPVALGGPGVPPLTVTISMGVAGMNGHDEVSASELLQRADDALYRSKAAGRNRVTLAVADPAGP